ncbi:hypothetical protein L6452_05481 [Arctium lappa]|uniref:Uncharacterized protein n=1 Tax=Arctium lappa TaxID=4217 RepID=A0ACB9EGJ7_ARCLA|nr:hypothetical protein L6452_05481 [Arctium lappa]
MYEIGMKLYADQLKALEISITKLVMEYLCMMFKPEEVEHLIRNVFQKVTNWTLYETSGVYALTMDSNHTEYFLVDRVYNHNRLKLHAMLKKKLRCVLNSEMAKYLIQRTINQSLGLNPNTVKLGEDCWEIQKCTSTVSAASTTWLLLLKLMLLMQVNAASQD